MDNIVVMAIVIFLVWNFATGYSNPKDHGDS